MRIGGREFSERGHTYVMGILNVTPDSFSDGGKYAQLDRALFGAEEMLSQGADVIDVGGESTRPGYREISPEEETDRIAPVIEAIKARFDAPVSLDTYKWQVAEAGIAAGADMINDIWGLQHDERIGTVIAKSGLPCCLMHNRKEPMGGPFLREIKADLEETLRRADRAGIFRERILLDPGVGFAKDYRQNLQAIASLDRLKDLGCPILLGCSRKSVIGLTLDAPVEERLAGTLAATVLAVVKGCLFVRVHDVLENVRAIRMTEAVLHCDETNVRESGREVWV